MASEKHSDGKTHRQQNTVIVVVVRLKINTVTAKNSGCVASEKHSDSKKTLQNSSGCTGAGKWELMPLCRGLSLPPPSFLNLPMMMMTVGPSFNDGDDN